MSSTKREHLMQPRTHEVRRRGFVVPQDAATYAAFLPDDFFCRVECDPRDRVEALVRFDSPDSVEDSALFFEERDALALEPSTVLRLSDCLDAEPRLEDSFCCEDSSTESRLTSLLKLLGLPFAVSSCTMRARFRLSNCSNHSSQPTSSSE